MFDLIFLTNDYPYNNHLQQVDFINASNSNEIAYIFHSKLKHPLYLFMEKAFTQHRTQMTETEKENRSIGLLIEYTFLDYIVDDSIQGNNLLSTQTASSCELQHREYEPVRMNTELSKSSMTQITQENHKIVRGKSTLMF